MSEWIKKYWWVLLIAVVAIMAPLVINWVILQPQKFEVVGDGAHWLGFWATYISAVASFAMVLITWYTLKQNKEQLEEIKRQWEMSTKPILLLDSIEINPYCYLKVKNTGILNVSNISISITKESLNQLNTAINKSIAQNEKLNLTEKPFNLCPQESKLIQLFTWREWANFDELTFKVQIDKEPSNYYTVNFTEIDRKHRIHDTK